MPTYDHPPVVETVLGVQFDLLPDFKNSHLGAYWGTLGGDWPRTEDAPALQQQFERFGAEQIWWPAAQVMLTGSLASRLQVIRKDGSRMIQAQNGRFHYNWLGQDGTDYPSYSVMRPEFHTVWQSFQEFLVAHDLGTPKINQWELTYVDRFPKGSGWDDLATLRLFSRLLGPVHLLGGVRMEGLAGEWHFTIPPDKGRLHVEIKHGKGTEQQAMDVIVMTLTSRGPASTDAQLREGLDLGHQIVLESFDAIIPESIKQEWRPKP